MVSIKVIFDQFRLCFDTHDFQNMFGFNSKGSPRLTIKSFRIFFNSIQSDLFNPDTPGLPNSLSGLKNLNNFQCPQKI